MPISITCCEMYTALVIGDEYLRKQNKMAKIFHMTILYASNEIFVFEGAKSRTRRRPTTSLHQSPYACLQSANPLARPVSTPHDESTCGVPVSEVWDRRSEQAIRVSKPDCPEPNETEHYVSTYGVRLRCRVRSVKMGDKDGN